MLHCGLHAINAILEHHNLPLYTADQLDDLTQEVHRRERDVCPSGTDLVPHPEGYYPLETLILAMRNRRFRVAFVNGERPGSAFQAAAGYVIGTGHHYLAVRPSRGDRGWELVDNGHRVRTAATLRGLLQSITPRPQMVVSFFKRT